MKQIKYLSLEEILAIHFDQIERYGGSHGVRDLNLLLSAIARPQASFGGSDLYDDVYKKGSSLIYSVISNHPFIDGNKRTGIVSLARFLFINDLDLVVTNKDLIRLALTIARNKMDFEQILNWLKKHSKKI